MNAETDNDRPIVRADPRARRHSLLWLLVVSIIGLACYLFLADLAADLDALATRAPELAAARAARLLQVFLGIGAAFALIAATWLARLGTRILAAGRYPLPGARLTRDTRLRTGEAARRIAWLGFFCAGVLALAAVGLLVTGWKLLALLTPAAAPAG